MNSKMRHLLTLVLVFLGIVILALPFIYQSNIFSKRSQLDKMPPFPDQATQLTTPEIDTHSKPKTVAFMQEDPLAIASTAWVVQVGNFKHKTVALHLVNLLRQNGYRAFTRQTAEVTHVFIGPESKPSAAFAVANTLATELHINGIIKSYKPLKL